MELVKRSNVFQLIFNPELVFTGLKKAYCLPCLCYCFFLSFALGRYPISPEQLITVLAAKFLPIAHTWPATLDTVVYQVRLPRIAATMLVGAALSTSETNQG